LLEALVAYLGDGNEWAAERLAREPGWVLDSALRQTGERTVFAEHLTQLHPSTIQELRLGKRTEALLNEATALTKQLDRYAYGSTAIRFTDEDIDQQLSGDVAPAMDLDNLAAKAARRLDQTHPGGQRVNNMSSTTLDCSTPQRRAWPAFGRGSILGGV
jgi:hypothetical protein